MAQKSLLSSLRYLIAGSGATKVLSLPTVVLVVNTFGNAEYGQYLLVIGAVSLVGTAYALISGQIYQVEFARLAGQNNWQACESLHRQALRLTGLTGAGILALAAITWLVIEFVPSVPSWLSGVQPVLVLAAVLSVASGIKEVVVGTNRGWKRFRELAIWDTMEATYRLALVGAAILANRIALDVMVLVAVDCMVLLLGALSYWLVLRNKTRPSQEPANPVENLKLTALIRDHGLWFALRLLTVELTANGRNWLIAGAISFEALGVFGVAKRIAQSGKVLLPMGILFNSYFSHQAGDAQNLKSSYVSGMRHSSVISFSIMAILIVFAFIGAPLVFKENIETLQVLIVIMSFIYPVKIVTYGVNSMLNVDRRYKHSLAAVGVSAISMAVLAPPLIYWLGIYGIAIETILSSIVGAIVAYVALIRHRPDFRIPLSALVRFPEKSVKIGKN